MNYKWIYEGNTSFRQVLIILLGETLSGEIFVTFKKIRHFRTTKFRPIRYFKFGMGEKGGDQNFSKMLGGIKALHTMMKNLIF